MIDADAAARVVDIESIDTQDDGRGTYAWLRLADGRGALWTYDPALPVGQAQSLNVVDGAYANSRE